MEKIIRTDGMVSLTAAEGHKIYEMGKDPYGAVGQTTVKPEVADRYVEIPVGQILPYSEEQYKAKVDELVKQRYPQREENALQRKMINVLFAPVTLAETDEPADETADPSEIIAQYGEYNAYVESCKQEAKRMMEGGAEV